MRLSDTAVAAGGKSILMASQLLTGERLDVSQSTSLLSHRPTYTGTIALFTYLNGDSTKISI